MADPDYQQYLDRLHSGFNIPDEIVDQTTKEATGLVPLEKRRIQAGEANEVYDLTLPYYKHLIFRVSRNEDSDFRIEDWAINKVKAIGVPIPEMITIKNLDIDNRKVQICIQRKIDGEPLERGGIDYHSMDKQELRKIINQAGEILSRIHSIPVEGFELLDINGKGKMKTFADVMSMHLNSDYKGFYQVAKDLKLDEGVFKAQYEILSKKAKTVPNIQPVLNHNDYGPKHFMVKVGVITGIIDWGIVAGHSPINDFAKWVFWYPETPVEWLQEGYVNKDLFKGNYQDMLHLIMLNNSLSALWWYYESGYTKGVKDVFDRIKEILKFY